MSTNLIPFRSALGNIWGDLETEMQRAFGDGSRSGASPRSGLFRPNMNMVETENEFILTFDLPGITMENIAIELKGEELLVTGHRNDRSEVKDGRWHHTESRYGRFSRSVRMGHGLQTENIDAEYRDGVLTITVPKTEEVKSRRIDIRA